jgi:hypothetical protein
MNQIEVTLVVERPTKNKVRFQEPGDGPDKLGTIYVPNATMSALGNPESLTVTLAPGAALAAVPQAA